MLVKPKSCMCSKNLYRKNNFCGRESCLMALFQLQQSSKIKRCWSLLNLRIFGLILFFIFCGFDQFREKQFIIWQQCLYSKYFFNVTAPTICQKVHLKSKMPKKKFYAPTCYNTLVDLTKKHWSWIVQYYRI